MASEWTPLYGAAIGGVIGAFGGSWYQAYLRGRESVTNWFWQTAIAECVEPLICYLEQITSEIGTKSGDFVTAPESLPLPFGATARLFTITGVENITYAFRMLKNLAVLGVEVDHVQEAKALSDTLKNQLQELHKVLVSVKIKNRSDFYELHKLKVVGAVAIQIEESVAEIWDFCEKHSSVKV